MNKTKKWTLIGLGGVAILLLLTFAFTCYLDEKHIEEACDKAIELILNDQYDEALSVLSVIELDSDNEYSEEAALMYLCNGYINLEKDNLDGAELSLMYLMDCVYPIKIEQKVSAFKLKIEVANNNKEIERRKYEAELEREQRQKELEEKKTEQEFHYRPSSSLSNSNNKDDYYNVYDYDDPEDFYFDWEDDFEDYEDAEDYWEDAQE